MAKMKLKTDSGARKRFKLTKNGKIKRPKAGPPSDCKATPIHLPTH